MCNSNPDGSFSRPAPIVFSLSAYPHLVQIANPTLTSPLLMARTSPPSQRVPLSLRIPPNSSMLRVRARLGVRKEVERICVLPMRSGLPDHDGGSHAAVEYPYLGTSSNVPLSSFKLPHPGTSQV